MDFLINDGYSDRFNQSGGDGILGGPRVGPMTVPGGNDPAANYSITANAIADRELIEEAETVAQGGELETLLYKPLNASDEKYMWAYKGLFGFQIMDKDNNAFALRQDQEYSVEWDMVRYVSWLNGLVSMSQNTQMHRLMERIVVLGLIETDLKGGSSRRPGSQVSNNLILSGKQAIFNTGYVDITAGDLVYVTLPQISNGRLLQGGSARVPHMPKGLAPLITTPYNHRMHKGSGKLLYEALTTTGVISNDAPYTSQTLENARHLMQSMKMAVLLGVKELAEDNKLGGFEWTVDSAKDLMGHMSGGDMGTDNSFVHRFAKAVLDPMNNLLFSAYQPDMETVRQAHSDVVAQKSHAAMKHLPTRDIYGGSGQADFGKWVNLAQIRAYPELYASISDQENYVRSRIVCKAFTSASPGFNFDGLIFIGGTSSL